MVEQVPWDEPIDVPQRDGGVWTAESLVDVLVGQAAHRLAVDPWPEWNQTRALAEIAVRGVQEALDGLGLVVVFGRHSRPVREPGEG